MPVKLMFEEETARDFKVEIGGNMVSARWSSERPLKEVAVKAIEMIRRSCGLPLDGSEDVKP